VSPKHGLLHHPCGHQTPVSAQHGDFYTSEPCSPQCRQKLAAKIIPLRKAPKP